MISRTIYLHLCPFFWCVIILFTLVIAGHFNLYFKKFSSSPWLWVCFSLMRIDTFFLNKSDCTALPSSTFFCRRPSVKIFSLFLNWDWCHSFQFKIDHAGHDCFLSSAASVYVWNNFSWNFGCLSCSDAGCSARWNQWFRAHQETLCVP